MRCSFLLEKEVSKTQDSEILQILKVAEEDAKWFSEKYEELRIKYDGKVVAIKNRDVVGDAESVEELLNIVQKKGEDTAYLLIETIPAKDVSFIL